MVSKKYKKKLLLISIPSSLILIGLIICLIVFFTKQHSPGKPGPGGYFEGDGKASYTHYGKGESTGQGSCGGCVNKDQKYSPTYMGLFNKIQKEVGTDWGLAATSEAMMGGYCATSVGMGCNGRKNANGKTANAPCGSCWNLKDIENNVSLNVYVSDACPCGDKSSPGCANAQLTPNQPANNSKWCKSQPGFPNQANPGAYNHFDIWNGSVFGFKDTGSVTFSSVKCPDNLKEIMKKACCNTYFNGQGCPNICGHNFTCPR